MNVINIILIKCGIPESVTSFVIVDETTKDEIVTKAVEFFIIKIEENSITELSDDDKQCFIEDGYFYTDGIFITLIWADNVF